jgi:molecular chaperone DnaK
LHLQITEGEYSELDYVKIVGEGMIDLPEYPKGAPLEVIFEYDSDGIIHITVIDSTQGARLGELQIQRTSNLTESEVIEKRRRVAQLAIG